MLQCQNEAKVIMNVPVQSMKSMVIESTNELEELLKMSEELKLSQTGDYTDNPLSRVEGFTNHKDMLKYEIELIYEIKRNIGYLLNELA